MAYWNARRTLASTVARALSSCAAGSASRSRSRSRLAFALGAAKQTLPVADSVRLHPVRTKSSGSGYSPLNDPSPNWSNRPPKETILLDGCDYEHWLIVMEFPDNPKPSEDEMVNTYVKTLAHVLGRWFILNVNYFLFLILNFLLIKRGCFVFWVVAVVRKRLWRRYTLFPLLRIRVLALSFPRSFLIKSKVIHLSGFLFYPWNF